MTWFLIGSGPGWIKAYEDFAARPASVYVLVLQHALCKGMMLRQQGLYPFLMQSPSPTGRFKFKFTEEHLNIYLPQIIFLAYLVKARIRHFATLCSATVSISSYFHSQMPLLLTVGGTVCVPLLFLVKNLVHQDRLSWKGNLLSHVQRACPLKPGKISFFLTGIKRKIRTLPILSLSELSDPFQHLAVLTS